MNIESAKEYILANFFDGAKDVKAVVGGDEETMAMKCAVEAIEKQISEKPQKSESGTFNICPTCGRFINRREKSHGNIDIPRCKWCGQALEWSDSE